MCVSKKKRGLPPTLTLSSQFSLFPFPCPRSPLLLVSYGALQSSFMYIQANVNYDLSSPIPAFIKGSILCAHTVLHPNLPPSLGGLSILVGSFLVFSKLHSVPLYECAITLILTSTPVDRHLGGF